MIYMLYLQPTIDYKIGKLLQAISLFDFASVSALCSINLMQLFAAAKLNFKGIGGYDNVRYCDVPLYMICHHRSLRLEVYDATDCMLDIKIRIIKVRSGTVSVSLSSTCCEEKPEPHT